MPKIKLPYYEMPPDDVPNDLTASAWPGADERLIAAGFGDVVQSTRYTDSIYTNRWFDTYNSDQGYRGIVGGINGNLDTENLDPATLIKAQHIMPEQAALARMESMRESSTVFGNSSATTTDDEDEYFNLPGLSLRWYQPYAANVALCQWSFFLSFNSWSGRYQDSNNTRFGYPVQTTIKLRCTFDGTPLAHTERVLGENFFHPVSPGANNPWQDDADLSARDSKFQWGPGLDLYDEPGSFSKKLGGGNPRYVQTEAHSATHFDLHHLIGCGFTQAKTETEPSKYVRHDLGTDTRTQTFLTQGYHEIGVQCSIDVMQSIKGRTSGPVFVQSLGKATVVDDWETVEYKCRGHFNLTGKLSLGIRNARVMSFL